MKELIIISGKGGTGKTSLIGAFASLASEKVLCDADVDAADLYLILEPDIKEREDFQEGHKAVINKDKCTECGLCRELCRFNAISPDFVVNPLDCEGCGVCVHFCPEDAIDFPLQTCGELFVSDTRCGPMVHARLGIAEDNSGKLVTLTRERAKEVAKKVHMNLILTDGPPGLACPVIASITGATGVLIVTEPTLSGHHDMDRVVELTRHFGIPAYVCINKFDINPEMTKTIEQYAHDNGLPVMGKIPFDPFFTKAMVEKKTIIEYDSNSDAARAVKEIWEKVADKIGLNK
ncbi:MAG: 4Fe-4S binding protein [Thermodesulfobacteriota bacterium]|nr:4Fe-4S binding protein [Thermodesulfobacteriota bacterium]